MTRPLLCCSLVVLSLLLACTSEPPQLSVQTTDSNASFRGMSVVDDDVAWLGGSDGTIGRTGDGGITWDVDTIDGYGQFGFRSVYGLDATTAVIANAGSPAHILRTQDGGTTWNVVYTNPDTSAFIDGVDFWDDENGMMYGDPIGGRLLLIRTSDGGRSWADMPEESRPNVEPGEYSFAASGTGIRCYGAGKVAISTGGSISRLWVSEDWGSSWQAKSTPILQGEPTTGIFSFTFLNNEHVVIVGGDYLRDSLAVDHVFSSRDGGLSWAAPAEPTRGYRECVEVLGGNTIVAAGPTGVDISYDGGEHWTPLSDEKGFHVVRTSRSGSLVLLAGNSGKVAIVQ